MSKYLWIIIPCVLSIALVIVLFYLGIVVDKHYCLSAYSDFKPGYTVETGCRIQWKGKHVPANDFRIIGEK